MKPNFNIEKQLDEISDLLNLEYKNVPDIGVMSGISGMALFQFYYGRLKSNDLYNDRGTTLILEIINRLNNNYNIASYASGIAGAGWVIEHLNENKLIEINTDDILSDLDFFLEKKMKYGFSEGNFDFFYGSLGYGYYFLKRYQNTKVLKLKNNYSTILNSILINLIKRAIKGTDGLKWISTIELENTTQVYNFGLPHGVGSIMIFLSKLSKFPAFKKESLSILKEVLKFVLQSESKNNHSHFPSWIEIDGHGNVNSRLAWCYGDLGIALALYHSAVALSDKTLKQKSIEILKNTTKKREPNDTMVVDCGLCHGTYGNAQIYNFIYSETLDPTFKEATNFWIDTGLKMATYNDGYVGYRQWQPATNGWVSETSLLEGVAGIGLSMIDYLSKTPNTWDECLMIR